jgi:hypothetical protein
MDGGGLALTEGRTVTAWRRNQEIFLAEPGQPETKIGEGKDVALAASHGRTYALWVKDSQLVAWVDGNDEIMAAKAAVPAVVALASGGVLAAWEENNGISMQRLR